MFQIFVDSAANLPAVIAKQYNINVISFINLVDGKEVTCYNPDLSLEEERQKMAATEKRMNFIRVFNLPQSVQG